jgi:hypothetical protein
MEVAAAERRKKLDAENEERIRREEEEKLINKCFYKECVMPDNAPPLPPHFFPTRFLSPNVPPFQKHISLKPTFYFRNIGDILSQVRWAASREQGLVPPASDRTVAFRCDWKGAFMSR